MVPLLCHSCKRLTMSSRFTAARSAAESMSMWVSFLKDLLSFLMARVGEEVSEESWASNEADFVYLYSEYLGVMERMRVKRSSSWAFRRSRAFLCMFC